MILITKEARCDRCNDYLDLTVGYERIPYHGLFCQPCADWWHALIKHIAESEKERNEFAKRIERGEIPE